MYVAYEKRQIFKNIGLTCCGRLNSIRQFSLDYFVKTLLTKFFLNFIFIGSFSVKLISVKMIHKQLFDWWETTTLWKQRKSDAQLVYCHYLIMKLSTHSLKQKTTTHTHTTNIYNYSTYTPCTYDKYLQIPHLTTEHTNTVLKYDYSQCKDWYNAVDMQIADI